MNKIFRIIIAATWFVFALIFTIKSELVFTPFLNMITDGWGQIFAWLGILTFHAMIIFGVPTIIIWGGFGQTQE